MNEAGITFENADLHGTLDRQQQLGSVLENTAKAILIFDSQSHLLFANPAGRKLFDDYKPKAEYKIPVDSGYESLQQLLEKARQFQTSLAGEIIWDDKRIFSVEIIPVQGDNCAVILYDISHFKEHEKLKDESFAAAVHDLKNPITSIIGFSDLVKRMGPLTDRQQESVQYIQNAAANMSELVNNMLNLSKMELGDESKYAILDLASLLREIAAEFKPKAEAKRQFLTIDVTALNSIVQGDTLQLRQALRNLVSNAVKYSPEGGAIKLSLHSEVDKAQIKIKAAGYDIPSLDLPHTLGRPYYVHDNEQDCLGDDPPGLAIVKFIAEQHGGEVIVESEPGKGSCFTLTLPLLVPVENK